MNINSRAMDNLYDKLSLLRHPRFNLIGQQLDKVLAASHIKNHENTSLNTSIKTSVNTTARTARTLDTQTTTTTNGNKSNTNSLQNIVDTVDISTQKQLSQTSEQITERKVNGQDVYSRTLRDTQQTVDERRQAATSDGKTGQSNTTRDVQKNGSQTRVLTHTDNISDQQTSNNTAITRQTDTASRYKTYDKNGQLVGEKYNRQIVNTDQTSSSSRTAHNEGTRDIDQNSAVVQLKEGQTTIRQVDTDTSDLTKNQQVIKGQTSTQTATSVQSLNEQGEVLSARTYSQQTDSTEDRVIGSQRLVTTDQESRTLVNNNKTKTENTTHTTVAGTVTDQSTTLTAVKNYDQDGSLTSERNLVRQVNTTSTEERDLVNNTQYTLEKKNHGTIEKTDLEANEDYSLQTNTQVDQDGVKSERQVITQGEVDTQGKINNELEEDGDRHIQLQAEQTRNITTSDHTNNANNQAKEVTTTTWSAQSVEGDIDFEAVGSTAAAVPGKIVIELGSNTGLRTSFKMDDGVLRFDFSAQQLGTSEQTTVSSTGSLTPVSNQEKLENLHFTGEVTSRVDEAGNRVLNLTARVVDEQDAVMINGSGGQTEERDSEYEVTGSLQVSREQTQDGSSTTAKVTSTTELNVNKVETADTDGYNVRNLTALTNADAVKAGFINNSNGIRFNFGSFNVGISFQA